MDHYKSKWTNVNLEFNTATYSKFLSDIKVVPDSPAYVQKVTIFWYVKK